MALTLTANIDAATREFRVTGTVPGSIVAGYRFRLGDELLELTGFARWPVVAGVRKAGRDPNGWIVNRAIAESVAASHTAGASILGARDAWTSGEDEDQPDPFPAGGASSADAVTVSPAVAGESDVQGALEALAAGVKVVTRPLSSADLLGLFDTPVVLVAGQAGVMYLPFAAAVVNTGGDVAYATTGFAWVVQIGAVQALLSGSLTVTDASPAVNVDSLTLQQMSAAAPVGSDMTLTTDAALTLGDGTAVVVVLYHEISVA